MFLFYEKTGEKANKNSQTAQLCLRELVDPCRSPNKNGQSRLTAIVGEEVEDFIAVGDNGNGYRGIPMSFYHNSLFKTAGLTVEQIPLCPSHAYNDSDRHIARLNTYFG